MAWSGGTYTKGNNSTGGWTGDAAAGIGIEAGRHDTQDNDFATGINQCLNKDGSNAATGNLNIGSFRLTAVAAATARTDAAQAAQVQDGDYVWLGTTAGTATAQTASATPAITAYKAGQKFRMKIGSGLGSTGAAVTAHTLNVNSVGAKNLKEMDGANPTIGTWVAGAILECIYDGTNFIITNDPGGWLAYTITTSNFTGISPNVITSITSSNTRYRKIGKMVHLQSDIQINLGTGGGNSLDMVVPINASANNSASNMFYLGATAADAVGNTLPFLFFVTASNLRIVKNVLTSAFWTAGTGTYIRFTIVYESV